MTRYLPRRDTRLPATARRAVSVAALVAALLVSAGCTGARSGASTSGSPRLVAGTSPTTAGAGPGTGASGGPGTGASGTTGGGGPVTAGTGAGSAAGTAQIPPITYRADPADAAVERVLPGMYGLDSLGATVHGHTVTIAAPAGCGFVLEVIGAGQWRAGDLRSATKDDPRITAVLTEGARSAALSLSTASTDCQGDIVAPVDGSLQITGAVREPGAAQLYPLVCEQPDPDTGGLAEFGYTTAHGAYLVGVSLPGKVGSLTVKGEGAEFVVYQASATAPDLGAMIAAQRALTSPAAGRSGGGAPAGIRSAGLFQPVVGSSVTVTLRSVSPVAGSLVITGAARQANPGGSVTVRADFSCGG